MSEQDPYDPSGATPGDVPPPPPPPPPTGGYPPPPPGYPPPPGGMPPTYDSAEQPLSPSDEHMWALLAHLSIFVLSIVGPILIMVFFGKRSAFVDDQSKEALNFHISVLIAAFVSALLCLVLIGFVLLPIVIVGSMVLGVVAAMKANQGVRYRYPITIRFIR